MKPLVVILILLLAVLHQDFWWWDDYEPLVFGFMPIGLAWHMGISIGAGLVGLLAIRYCWPDALDRDDPAAILRGEATPTEGEGS